MWIMDSKKSECFNEWLKYGNEKTGRELIMTSRISKPDLSQQYMLKRNISHNASCRKSDDVDRLLNSVKGSLVLPALQGYAQTSFQLTSHSEATKFYLQVKFK